MMRDLEYDKRFITEAVKRSGVKEAIYITPNLYDGGYEVRVGSEDFFFEYPVIDGGDKDHIENEVKKRYDLY
ncbi:hypothetical protein KBC55_00595 [Patescibacteria group bacterium]|nr:hypothetical protein [Patescibacteria group bacterium]